MSQPTSTPEQQHLARLRHNLPYAEWWKAKHAHQQAQSESPLSNGKHANETPIIEAINTTSSPDSFFNSYWFPALVVVLFLILVMFT